MERGDRGALAVRGELTALDSVIDQGTRNVQVQATLGNADGTLRPGMFVQASVELGASDPVVTLPATAISYAPYGDSVFIVEEMAAPDGRAIRSLSVRQYPKSDIAVVRVTTAYVGADADLVRGFITTPLERVIASADGVDYLESSSAQGRSTITVHLRLNYDTNAALTQIQAKVAQVRNDPPPEAEAPVIELETADTQFASMYLGFSSEELDQNQITDYLTRVVQPKLSAIAGVQRADNPDLAGRRRLSFTTPRRSSPAHKENPIPLRLDVLGRGSSEPGRPTSELQIR